MIALRISGHQIEKQLIMLCLSNQTERFSDLLSLKFPVKFM